MLGSPASMIAASRRAIRRSVAKREVLVVADAVRERVGVHVREPENGGRDGDQRGDARGGVGIGLRSRDDHREDHDRPVDEAAEPLADPHATGLGLAALIQSVGHRRES